MSRLFQVLESINEIRTAPPLVIHHALRSGLVHAVNMTAEDQRTKRVATQGLNVCLRVLNVLAATWPVLANITREFIETTAASWELQVKVDGADSARSMD